MIILKHKYYFENEKLFEANGIELGALQTQLLLKIEELTLYVIELKKEIEDLKKR